MRKLFPIILILVLLFSVTVPAAAAYDGTVNPESVLLLNLDSGEILYEKNADESVWPASTTKILTALVVLEQVENLDDTVTVDGNCLDGITEGDDSTMVPMLTDGEQISVRNLLYGLLLVSGNDAAYTLANYVGGSVSGFVDLMNAKAAELGMANSHFANPAGTQDENHYTTASDMAKLTKAAVSNSTLMEIAGTVSYTIPATNKNAERSLTTSNRLLEEQDDLPGTSFAYATGLKTGYTPTSGGCLVATAEKDGTRIACLIYGDDSDGQQERWLLAKDMLSDALSGDTAEAAAADTADVDTDGSEDAAETADTAAADETQETQAETADETAAAEETEQAAAETGGEKHMAVWLKILLSLVLLAVIAFTGLLLYTRVQSIRRHQAKLRKAGRRVSKRRDRPSYVTGAILIVLVILLIVVLTSCGKKAAEEAPAEETVAEPVVETPTVHSTDATDPDNWGITWQIGCEADPESASSTTELLDSYERTESLSFDDDDYFSLPGIATFRGNNYRNSATYGTAEVNDELISVQWTSEISSLGSWTGSGWTGQPLIVQWDDATRQAMNIYDSKKDKEGLTEVIYATLDGYIYFYDIDDGEYTRDPLYLGMAFKGAGALDPRGYPIMYVGSGDAQDGEQPRMFIINLLDTSVMMEYGYDDDFALRLDHDNWCAYDSSPLVYADGDLLIWPGENGVLYTMKLNTSYNRSAGTLSIDPDEVIKTRYTTARSSEESYWYGYEDSAVIAGEYLYVSENGGMFYCVDLNTMELVWAQDTNDDSNSTPVYETDEDGNAYIYTAPSLHWTAEDGEGYTYIYKLDANTGEYVWAHRFPCYTVEGVSGGVQSSPLLGKEGSELDGLIIYTIARTPDVGDGLIVAFDTKNGCEVWRTEMDNYAWSSPAAFYEEDGNAYIAVCDSAGKIFLLEGSTGEVIDYCDAGSLIEASPAIYEDKLVVGTRGQQIYMLQIH